MNYNEFVSNEGLLKFDYPSHLTFVEEEDGTYLFYNEQTGSFRVTPLKLANKNFDADKYLKTIADENKGEILTNHKNIKYVFYISSSEYEEDLTIFNWIIAAGNSVIYCSYTIDSVCINDDEVVEEKNEIIKIIENLKLNV